MPSDSSQTNSGAAARVVRAESGSMTPSSAAVPPARSTGPATSPSMAMPRGTRPDRYISQPRISPFPTPTTQPGPSRNVQSWIATSDLPAVTNEPGSHPGPPHAQPRRGGVAQPAEERVPHHGQQGADPAPARPRDRKRPPDRLPLSRTGRRGGS